jgi:outer membrane protein W
MRKIMILLLALLTIASAAMASSLSFYEAGDVELGLLGSYSHLDASASGSHVSANLAYLDVDGAYFVTENISIGLGTELLYAPSIKAGDSEADVFAGLLAMNARYHYQVNSYFIPYVGVHLGYGLASVGGDSDRETTSITSGGAQLGFKVPVNDHVYFDTQLKYTDYSNIEFGDTGIDLDSTQVLFGLKIKL